MNNMDINKQISEDQKYLRDVFGDHLPLFSCIPNIVMPSTSSTLKYVLRTISRSGCVCFNEPPHDRTDYIHDDEDYLHLWAKNENQRFLIENGCFYPQFVIDANTSTDLLSMLNKPSPLDTFEYLVNNIDTYRWFYMPMSDEEPIAIFVCRLLDKQWIGQITQKFKNVAIPYTQVLRHGDQDMWRLNDELRELWRIHKRESGRCRSW